MPDPIATRDAYGKTLAALGETRSDIVVLDGDLSGSTRTGVFGKIAPERFFDLGICEANLAGVAAGLATCGKTPFMSTFAVFAPGRCLDQIRLSIAHNNLNVKIVTTHAGLTVGEDGASAQACEDLAVMRAMPNMKVICPADGPETEAVIRAIARDQGPTYVRLGRGKIPVVYEQGCDFHLGRAITLRQGADAAVIACGVMVAESLDAADQLAQDGIAVRVVDMACIKPLDADAILSAARDTGAVVTAEEHNIMGGLGGAVAEVLVEHFPVPMERVGVRDVFGRSGKPRELMEKFGIAAADIVAAVRRVIARKAI